MSLYLKAATDAWITFAQVDAISETLQQRCGSFCSADDVLLYKVSLPLSLGVERVADSPSRCRLSKRYDERRTHRIRTNEPNLFENLFG